MKINFNNLEISIVGLGYIGLPLALEFAKYRKVLAYDNNLTRINELKKGLDESKELTKKEILKSKKIYFTNNLKDLEKLNCFIICVPTPVTTNHKPDIKNIRLVTKEIGKIINKNSLVIYE